MHDEAKQSYYAELKIGLTRLGLTAEQQENGLLEVKAGDTPICYVHDNGSVGYNAEVSNDESLSALKDKVFDQARTVAEYMRLMNKAPVLIANGLEDRYKLLADFNGTVLAGMNGRYGVQFATWDWDLDGSGLHWGHYHGNSYEAAKEDFATRSGMVGRERLFSDAQLAEVYRCIHETMENAYPMTDQRRKLLIETSEQVERAVPDLNERVEQSNRLELEHGMQFGELSM